MPSLEEITELLNAEVRQRTEEGCDTGGFESLLEQAKGNEKNLLKVYRKLSKLKTKKNFPYVEPSDLEKIRRKREKKKVRLRPCPGNGELFDKIYGAWLGRCAGCMLGKPVEGWSHEEIRKYLAGADEYPLSDYFPENSSTPPEKVKTPYKYCTKGNFSKAERDDDTDYTVLGLEIIEEKGTGFMSSDVMEAWLSFLPYHKVYTAERRAYRNAVDGLLQSEWASFFNPCREWIGAQIRADFWGYCACGNPELASEFAHRDAIISHVKNGIYGEMLFSAIIATAFCAETLEDAIKAGLSQIPKNSRLAETAWDCFRFRQEFGDFESARQKMMETYYGKYSPVHTNNNAGLVLLALLFGEQDFEKTVCLAVSGGLDTDCNGATAGSVIGAFLGAEKLPSKWIAPMNDTLESAVFGYSENKISELAKRTLAVAKKVIILK